MKCTMYTVAAALERAPYLGPILVEHGHEIACHGNRWINYMNVPPEEEERQIHHAIDRLQKYTSDPNVPRGWMIGRRSNASPRLYCRAAKERGLEFLYSSDSYGDDLPYWLESPLASEGEPDEGMLIIPYTLDCNDFRFVVAGSGWSSGEDFYNHLVDTFDVLYEEGLAGQAKMMSIGLHNRCVGRPGRLAAVEKFMQYISSKEGVWVARRDEIARHWREKFPYTPERCQGRMV
ncbi:glycoside hydrolase/deacetylase [Dendrothele bispora CBS 962.96]|uniref:Glycoside hydrolase/deacetylase n=1 Tax=Dendrothele bispora (strain CBS 962.96) TaxID=1314807 RepID=A0A4S8MJ49_DENBC|nr:glycoside hydrolase/deacetylase [Dendrothele bispora CBS 962.96]